MKTGQRDGPKSGKIKPEWVYKMASYGCRESEIAGVFGVDVSLISASFSKEYHKGLEHMRAKLRKRQYQLAMDGNFTMLIWLGKQMLGQKEPAHEITGEGGGPIKSETSIKVVSEAAKKMTEKILAGEGTEDG